MNYVIKRQKNCETDNFLEVLLVFRAATYPQPPNFVPPVSPNFERKKVFFPANVIQ